MCILNRAVSMESEKSGHSGDYGHIEGMCLCLLQSPLLAVHNQGAMRGVTVSMSAFLACHQCYCAGSSLAWGLNLRAVVCGIF